MSIQEKIDTGAFERLPKQYTYHEVAVSDSFETGHRERIEASLRELESMGYYDDTNIDHALARKRLSAIDYNNPATKELLARVPGVEHWLALVPTPRALSPLYDPSCERLPGGHIVGDELRTWMTEIADARGLRYRSQMVTGLLTEKGGESDQHEQAQWLSIASGAAQPILRAAQLINERTGSAPYMTLVDLSSEALHDAKSYADSLGLRDNLRIERNNVLRRQGLHTPVRLGEVVLQRMLNPNDRAKLSRAKLPEEGYDVVEAVGILEYMKPEDWPYRYNGVVNLKTMQAGAKTFLKNSYRLVKPGGDLIVGNMLDTHPQLGFTLNTIQWPHIQPRSIDEMMDIFDEVGIEGERHVYVPDDEENRVYALYRIHKPEIEGN